MGTYGGYINGAGLARMLADFTKQLDAIGARMKAAEECEDSRLGIGYGYTGYADGVFLVGGKVKCGEEWT